MGVNTDTKSYRFLTKRRPLKTPVQGTFSYALAAVKQDHCLIVDVVPQERPIGAHDQHVDDVEADLRVKPSGWLASQPAAAISKSARETLPPSKPPSPYSVAVTSMKTRVSSSLATRSIWVPSGEVQPVSRSSYPLRSMNRVAALRVIGQKVCPPLGRLRR